MNEEKQPIDIPNRDRIEAELDRIEYVSRYRSVIKSTAFALLSVAAVAILITTLLLPFLRIYGTSMTPTLENGNIVACIKTSHFKEGDVIAFYYNNKILVKRVIGKGGDYVDVQEDGSVFVNGKELDEPYISEKALGECDVAMPYQVPENTLFVMGDHRETSVDSRSSTVGTVSEEQIVGKVILRIWPLNRIGGVR